MDTRLIIGCNYHTKWQSNKGMRFVLGDIKGNQALLYTRKTNKKFWTNVADLVFITSECNIKKAKRLQSANIDDYINLNN